MLVTTMTAMAREERLRAAIEGEEVDRPPVAQPVRNFLTTGHQQRPQPADLMRRVHSHGFDDDRIDPLSSLGL